MRFHLNVHVIFKRNVYISDGIYDKKKIQDDLFRIHFGCCSIQDKFRILGCLFRMIFDKQAYTLVSEASKLSAGARFLGACRALKYYRVFKKKMHEQDLFNISGTKKLISKRFFPLKTEFHLKILSTESFLCNIKGLRYL